jgi:hypothetical protein
MESVSSAKVEFVIPELDDIPDQRTQITKTGKLSSRKMAQRDRVELYTDFCTGMALHLCYEVFRVLAPVGEVKVLGRTNGIDPGTGHTTDFISLQLHIARSGLESLDLDAINPSAAFERLGGRFGCDRKGGLAPIRT